MLKKTESFDDIVFENRNKAYGAYDLRKRYSRRGSIALAVSVFIVLSAVAIPLLAEMIAKPVNPGIVNPYDTLVLISIKDNPDKVIPPPPPPPPAPKINEIKFKPISVVDSVTNEELDIKTNDDLLKQGNQTLGDTAQRKPIIINPEPKFDPDIPLELNDPILEKPMFPGGEKELLKYIAQNTVYPGEAVTNEIEGTVYVRFAVMKTGLVDKVQIFKSSGEKLLDDEAIRVINTLPVWVPGKINGNAVSVWFLVPVRFKLTKM
jgi:protein TonB